jgi:hypothetical protein
MNDGITLLSEGAFQDLNRSLAGALGRKTLGIANRRQSWDPDDLLNTRQPKTSSTN